MSDHAERLEKAQQIVNGEYHEPQPDWGVPEDDGDESVEDFVARVQADPDAVALELAERDAEQFDAEQVVELYEEAFEYHEPVMAQFEQKRGHQLTSREINGLLEKLDEQRERGAEINADAAYEAYIRDSGEKPLDTSTDSGRIEYAAELWRELIEGDE